MVVAKWGARLFSLVLTQILFLYNDSRVRVIAGVDRTVATASRLVLRAAKSFDEDVDYKNGGTHNLQYSWGCKKCLCF